MLLWFLRAVLVWIRPRSHVVAENLCLRQQLIVLKRSNPRPRLRGGDRRFWLVARQWYPDWRDALILVRPETVVRWHRQSWRAYWRWKSNRRVPGRPPIGDELRALIRRISAENPLWGQRRVQAELKKLGYRVSARTVAKYMMRAGGRSPSPGWRKFLKLHAESIWACDFFCVQTITFRTVYGFFIIHHATREIVHVRVTRHPTAAWAAQQITEACHWDRDPPRYLIHDRDARYGAVFERRVASLGIKQIRTPYKAPMANSIAERWAGSARRECLDWTVVFTERQLQRLVDSYAGYYNASRPHQTRDDWPPNWRRGNPAETKHGQIVAEPVLGGLHHVYRRAA